MTNETGLLRDLNLKPGDTVTMDGDRDNEIMEVVGINDSDVFPEHFRLGSEVNGYGLYNDYSGTFTIVSRAPRKTGTLKEIGAKVGDVVESEPGYHTEVCQRHLDSFMRNNYRIISRATPTSPVRTVTRKEIVPGTYDGLSVYDMGQGDVGIEVDCVLGPIELDTLIQNLQEIRDAL